MVQSITDEEDTNPRHVKPRADDIRSEWQDCCRKISDSMPTKSEANKSESKRRTDRRDREGSNSATSNSDKINSGQHLPIRNILEPKCTRSLTKGEKPKCEKSDAGAAKPSLAKL